MHLRSTSIIKITVKKMVISPECFVCFRWDFQNWKEQSFHLTIGTEGITQLLKSNFERSKYKLRHQCHAFSKKRTFFRSFWDLQITFVKFVEAAKNLIKFVGLANNFWKVCKTRKNFMKFADWRSDLSAWKFFFKFHSWNISVGKHKCFVNPFHISWILFTNKLNSGCYIRVGKIFGTVKKWLLVALDRWSFYAV